MRVRARAAHSSARATILQQPRTAPGSSRFACAPLASPQTAQTSTISSCLRITCARSMYAPTGVTAAAASAVVARKDRFHRDRASPPSAAGGVSETSSLISPAVAIAAPKIAAWPQRRKWPGDGRDAFVVGACGGGEVRRDDILCPAAKRIASGALSEMNSRCSF